MSEFRIMDHNYVFDDASNLLVSSEDTAFPSSNLTHYFRSKVFRTAGYFVITTSNNKIDFKDASGGAQKTATLIPGTYTAAALAVHIKGVLEQQSSEIYTVSFSASQVGCWIISTAGAFLSLLWTTGTNTATALATTIGFTAGDSTGATTYTAPAIACHTEEWVVVDLGSSENIDSFAMLFDPRTGSKFTNDAVIKLQASNANVWSAPSVDVTVTRDDTYDVITYFFSSAQAYRFWRIKVTDVANPYGYIEIPKLILSMATQLTQVPEIGFSVNRSDPSRLQTTPYGHVYSDIYPSRRTLKFNYSALAAEDIETLYSIYERLGASIPLAVALDPTATTFDKDRFFLYGRLQPSMDVIQRFYTYFDAQLTVEEAL